jgi:hypothetical protein
MPVVRMQGAGGEPGGFPRSERHWRCSRYVSFSASHLLSAFAHGTPGGFLLRAFALPDPKLAGAAFVEIMVAAGARAARSSVPVTAVYNARTGAVEGRPPLAPLAPHRVLEHGDAIYAIPS